MELVRKSIPYYDVILDNVTVYEESTDAIVPDTFPDIARITYADGTVSVKDKSPQNDRILVSGSVMATVLYQPENETSLRRQRFPANRNLRPRHCRAQNLPGHVCHPKSHAPETN